MRPAECRAAPPADQQRRSPAEWSISLSAPTPAVRYASRPASAASMASVRATAVCRLRAWSARRRASTRLDGSHAMPALLGRVGEILLGIDLLRALPPRHLIIATDAFAIAEPATAAALSPAVEKLADLVGSSEKRPVSSTVPLSDWTAHQRAIQGREAWSTFGEWIDRTNPRLAFDIADNFLRGKQITDAALAAARAFQAARRTELLSCFRTRRSCVCRRRHSRRLKSASRARRCGRNAT